MLSLFPSNDAAPPEIYTLSLHDALPIFRDEIKRERLGSAAAGALPPGGPPFPHSRDKFRALRRRERREQLDRKSTRLNSSHTVISYAVFCLKKKTAPGFADGRQTARTAA